MPKPNFFIVGAPRCGTTAMYEYLRQHPEIFMSSFKEPHYFGSDLEGGRFELFRDSEQKYLALFADAGSAKRIGEGSTRYLYSTRAAAEIKAFNPDARILIMLRAPVEVMYSSYQQASFTGTEDLPTFEEALAAEVDRRAGRRIPKRADNVLAGRYRETVQFTDQVQRYFDVFGREAVRVIVFDDFKKDVAAVYRATLEFLGVDPDFQPTFEVVNASRQVRNPLVRNLLMNPIFLAVGKRAPVLSSRLYQFVKQINSQPAPRPALSPELEQRLKQELRPEIERLSQLLERDLTHWCKS